VAAALEVDTSEASLRSRYQAEFADRLAHIHDLTRQRQIPILPLDTERDVPAQLRDLLGARLARRSGNA